MSELPFGVTEKEAEVLRLVDRTRTTGEIATIVGRSTSTVDHQIKSARRRIGNAGRYHAADRFRQAEQDSQRASRPAQAIPDRLNAVDQGNATNEQPDEGLVERVEEVPAALIDPKLIKLPQASISVEPAANASSWMTVARIMSLAIMLILMLLAAPQLAHGAERIALWLLPH